MGAPGAEAAVSAKGLSKSYGAQWALFGADLTLQAGERTFVCGENGAGKSTLLRIVAGLVTPDQGAVLVHGLPLEPHAPSTARARGVCMVEQHFALVPTFSVLENVILGHEPQRGLRKLDTRAVRAQIERLSRDIGAQVDPDARTGGLGVAAQQSVEIVRALYWGARVLILDEPTAVLSPREAEALYAVVGALAAQGTAVAVVTHKLDEVRAHADRVLVLRKGRVVSSVAMPKADDQRSATMTQVALDMMGGVTPVAKQTDGGTEGPSSASAGDAPVLLRLRGAHLGARLRGVDLDVRAGEIVGIAGVEGSGQRELIALAQGTHADDGEVHVASRRPVAVVPEDRHDDGLVLPASLRDNVLLGEFGAFSRMGVLDLDAMDREATRRLSSVGASALSLQATAASLSGGNQQKVVFARALGQSAARLLVCAHPTRGVDFAASQTLHQKIRDARDAGYGVLLISADTDELRALSDRIVVMFAGRIAHEFPPDTPDAVLGPAMLGTEAARAEPESGPPAERP